MIIRLKSCVVAAIAAVVGVLSASAEEYTLPQGYTKLDWIETKSDRLQRIDTDYTVTENTAIEFDFGHPDYANDDGLIGTGAWGTNCYLIAMQDRVIKFFGSGSYASGPSAPILASEDYHISVNDQNQFTIRIADARSYSVAVSRSMSGSINGNNLSIFGDHFNGSHIGRFRFYRLKVFEGGELKRDYVPCYNDSSKKPGVYDLVLGKFFSNARANTGNFNYQVTKVWAADELRTVIWLAAKDTTTVTDAGNWLLKTGDGSTAKGEGAPPATVERVELAADADWRTTDASTIPAYAKIDLKGHRLQLNLAAAMTPIIEIADSTGGGELEITVDEGVTADNTALRMTGLMKVVKKGTGTLKLTREWQNFSGGLVVREGTVQAGANGCTCPYGIQGGTVTVESGGTFDINGIGDHYDHTFVLAGGRLVNNGADLAIGAVDIRNLTVNNATQTSVIRLNFTFAGRLSGGGALATDGAQFQFGTGWTWAIKAAGKQVVEKVKLCDLENEDSTLFKSMDKLTRLEVANIGDEPLAPKLAICRAGNMTDAKARDVTVLITDKDGVQRTTGTLMVEESYGVNMLYLHVEDGSPIYRATWTGEGEAGNLADPANWACSNETERVEGRLPTADTDVTMPVGKVVDIPSGAPFVCKSFALDGALSLGRNVDWSGLGVPLDGVVYLNGHTLTLPSLAGTAQIFNSPEAGYETLDFIEATGSQAINTEYYFGAKDMFVVDAYIPTSQTKTYACLFGTRNNTSNAKNSTSFWLAQNGSRTMGYIRAGGTGGVNRNGNSKFEYGRRVTLTCTETGASWVTSGGETVVHKVSPTDTDVGGYAPLAIFGINNGSSETDFTIDGTSWCSARLYSFKIYDEDGSTLKRSYTPVRRSCDGVAGLWESVEGRFFASASETPLLSGPLTRTPTDAEMGTVKVTVAEGTRVPAGSGSVRMAGAIRYVQDGAGELAAAVTAVAEAAKVELAAGTLTLTAAAAASLNAAIVNDGTLAKEGSGVVALTAALSGHGALQGANLRFDGTLSAWNLAASATGWTAKVSVDGVSDSLFLKNLGTLAVAYAGDATKSAYLDLAPAGALTAADVSNIVLRVTDANAQDVSDACVLKLVNSRLLLAIAEGATVTSAIWTGLGDVTNLSDPANWECKNEETVVENAIPTAETVVTLQADCSFNCPVGASFACKQVVVPATIADDLDWRGLTAPLTGLVDLKGHSLSLGQVTGDVVITDTTGPEYVELDYIEATGSQAINTEYYFGAKDVFVVDAYIPTSQAKTYACLFGTRNGTDNKKNSTSFWLAQNGSRKMGYVRAGGASGVNRDDKSKFEYGRRVTLTCTETGASWVTSGGETVVHKVSPTDTDVGGYAPLAIFGINNGSSETDFTIDGITWCCAQLYSFMIYDEDGTTLKRSYVPAFRTGDSKVGLWEEVEKRFFTNAGTGDFKYGKMKRIDGLVSGEVHIDVPRGATRKLGTGMFCGNVRVVKDGGGVLELSTTPQSFNIGGWDIAAGTVKASGNLANSRSFGLPGAVVTVREGATYDLNGQRDSRTYRFVLDGGTIANTGSDVAATIECMGEIALTKDSSLDVSRSFPLWGVVDLGGHDLSIAIATDKNLYLREGEGSIGGTFTNGSVTVTTGGWLVPSSPMTAAGRDMRTVDFTVGAAFNLVNSISVGNLTPKFASNSVLGSGTVSIYGVFTPNEKNYLNNFVLQDGATLNLANWVGSYDIAASVTGQTLGFAENSTVYVALGGRKVLSKQQIVSWPVGKKPNVKFRPILGASYGFIAKEDGLYVSKGIVIIFR